ncbi:aminoglycoside phosphotransferase family protein [Streptomyces specialis]|uniref:aminoglycoside phosphotransferase family protein n=1 Tax=Streptomyces specialis TaxID=498367 RepID=UPI00073EDFB6|nr:aminoglycoside phosphotransferase family protein [Streptomyces specialis]
MSQPLPALRGHHRIWQVLRAEGELAPLGRLKAGRPRPGAPRFDPRCFDNEEDLLIELALLGVERIAPVYRIGPGDLRVHGFIEGEPLSVSRPPGTPLHDAELAQLAALFGRMATVSPDALALTHRCPAGLRPRTSRDFLRGLIRFTRRRVWGVHRPRLGGLFTALGVDPGVLAPTGPLAREAALLTDRPFCLLHADLHRDNLIVAESDGLLWTIDWELALIGDPVYDLATHLHLMGYPPAQEREFPERWARAVRESLPGAAAGLSRDLPRYLAYKRVQSVFTDVIRQAHVVRSTPAAELPAQLARTGEAVSAVIRRAARTLGLGRVPGPRAVEAAYAAFGATRAPRVRSAAPATPSPAAPAATGTAAWRPGRPDGG